MDPKSLAAASHLLRHMTPEQVQALADALDELTAAGGVRERGGSVAEQGSVSLIVKARRVRFIEVRKSRDIGALDADGVPAGGRAGRV